MAFLVHLIGGIMCLLCFTSFLAWIPGLIIYLTQKDKSQFTAFHSLQSLILMGIVAAINFVLIIGGTALVILSLITYPIAILLNIGIFIYALMISLKAKEGEWAEYLFVGGLARDKHGKQG